MIGSQYIVAGVAIVFVSLGVYAWDADRALDRCVLSRVNDALEAEKKARETKAKQEEATRAITVEYDAQVARLRDMVEDRDAAINRAKGTACATPDLDALIDGLRWKPAASSSGSTSKPASK